MKPVIVTLSHGGFELARQIAAHLPGAEIHGLVKRVPQADVTFDAAADHLRALFAQHRPIIAVMAAGIVIRALAPLLSDKRREPPVIAVSDDGASVVPLLGGHSGANQFARDGRPGQRRHGGRHHGGRRQTGRRARRAAGRAIASPTRKPRSMSRRRCSPANRPKYASKPATGAG